MNARPSALPLPKGLGLGCSHIASLSTRPDVSEIKQLLDDAYAQGVRLFDTADIYGQGDSERLLSRVANRPDVMICTKAGLTLGVSQGAVRLIKPVLRPLFLRFRGLGKKSAQMRQSGERTDFDPNRLRARLQGSLKRLRRDTVDVFLLHSPALSDLEDGRLYDLLDTFQAQGLARMCGVSTRSVADATQIILAGRVRVVQVPMHPGVPTDVMLTAAQNMQVGVIAREVFHGLVPTPDIVRTILEPMANDPRVATILTGTTSQAHLRENIAGYNAVRPAVEPHRCT